MKKLTRRQSIAGAFGLAGALTTPSNAEPLSREAQNTATYATRLMRAAGSLVRMVIDDVDRHCPDISHFFERELAGMERNFARAYPTLPPDCHRALAEGFSSEYKDAQNKRAAEREVEKEREFEAVCAEYQRSLEAWETYVPTAVEIEEYLEHERSTERADFALKLEDARAMYMRYPELVTAEAFPPEYLEDLRRSYDDPEHEPDTDVSDGFMREVTDADREKERVFLKEYHAKYRKPKPPSMK